MHLPLKGFLPIVPLKATRDSHRFWFWLCGVQFDSAVWGTQRSLTLRYDAHREAWLPGVQHTAELDFAVGSTQRSLTLQCVHTAELESAVGSQNKDRIFFYMWCQWQSKRKHCFCKVRVNDKFRKQILRVKKKLEHCSLYVYIQYVQIPWGVLITSC